MSVKESLQNSSADNMKLTIKIKKLAKQCVLSAEKNKFASEVEAL